MANLTNSKFFPLFIFLFLLFHQQQLINAENETPKNNTTDDKNALEVILTKKTIKVFDKIGNIAENVGVFVPQVSTIIKDAKAIWKIFTLSNTFINGDQPEEKTDTDRLKTIIDNMQEIKENINVINGKVDKVSETVANEVSIDGKVDRIFKGVEKIYNLYEELISKVNHNISRPMLSDFCRTLLNSGIGIPQTMRDIYSEINAHHGKFFKLLEDRKQAEEMMCKNKYPTVHLLYDIYSSISLTELKGILLIQYAFNYFKNETYTFENDMKEYENHVANRLEKLKINIKNSMMVAVKDFWRCEGDGIEGKDYGKLSPIFSAQILAETRMLEKTIDGTGYAHWWGKKQNCPYYKNSRTGIAYDIGKHEIESKFGIRHYCDGNLRNCDLYDNRRADMTICVADPSTGRKYNKIQIEELVLGKDDYCPKKIVLERSFWMEQFQDDHCLCICDEEYKNNTNRYFSLRAATSNIQLNKVITGVRIVQKDKMFQFEIQEGELKADGNIEKKSLKWKGNSFNITDPETKANVDYHRISWDVNKVNLDELKAPEGSVLTGLKFTVENGAIKLAIRYTEFDFETGKLLNLENSAWKSEDKNPNRIGLTVKTNVPSSSSRHRPNEHKTGFIRFQMSSLETDVGQNVVPFVDLQSLTLNPSTLLSGAALIYKSSLNDAGYLAMKLISYNYGPHLTTKLNEN